jgi:hypothetical protein
MMERFSFEVGEGVSVLMELIQGFFFQIVSYIGHV